MTPLNASVFALAALALAACGTSATSPGGLPGNGRLIRNGDVVPAGQYQPVKMLRFDMGAQHGFCSGTLIGPRHYLTAAHCIAAAPQYLSVVGDGGGGPGTVPVSTAIVHADYSSRVARTIANGKLTAGGPADVALVLLKEPLPGPYAPLYTELLHPGESVTGVGFGETGKNGPSGNPILGTKLSGLFRFDRYVPVQLPTPSGAKSRAQIDDGFLVVVPGDAKNQNECPGDSGGPLLVGTADGAAVAGVVHAGNAFSGDRCKVYSEGGYTAIRPHLAFLRAAMLLTEAPSPARTARLLSLDLLGTAPPSDGDTSAAAMLASPEGLRRTADALAERFLHHAAVTTPAAAESDEAIAASMLGSDEYFTEVAPEGGPQAPQQFVRAVYADVLGRDAKPAELTAGVGAAFGAGSRAAFAETIVRSPEASRAIVGRWYRAFLRRAATPAELDSGVAGIAQSGQRAALATLLGGTEYAQLRF